MSRFFRDHSLFFFILAAFLSFAGLAGGQVAPGKPAFVTEDCHEVDCVDLLNNNISLNVPIRSKAGAINFNLSLNGSYYISLNTATTTWQPSQLLAAQYAPLTQASSYPGLDSSGYLYGAFALCPDGVTRTTEYSGFYIVVAGTYHYLPATDFTDTTGCYHQSLTDTTRDNSGYSATFFLSSLTAAYDSGGDTIAQGSITDSNGNAITFSAPTYTDTLGLTVLTAGSGNFPDYTWTDVNGGSPQVSFTTSSTVHLKSAFGCSNGVSDYDVTGQTLPSDINFPDGTTLGLTYEGTPGYSGDYTGRLNLITLREGGTIGYTYGGSNYGFNCTYQTVPVLTRKLGNGDTTTYTLAYSLISGSNYKATNTVVDPAGNQTIYTFTGFTSAGNSSTYGQVLTQVQHYQGTSTLLTTDIYCYNAVFASCSTTAAPTAQVTPPIAYQIVFHQINGMSNWSAQETHFDHYGNVTYSAAYDFGGANPTRATTITYGTCSTGCSTSNPTIVSIGSNVNNKPGEVVTTQNGSTVAQANYTYSTTAGHAGNLLSTSVWTGSAFIGQTTANTYNSNGTISTAYDLANKSTTYAYSSGSYTSCGSCTQYPFATSVSKGGLTTYSTWNGIGGVKLTDKDASGNTTSYGYKSSGGTADPWWRLRSVTDPLSNEVWFTPTATSYESSFTFNSGNSIQDTTTTLDGYGRPINLQKRQSPSSSYYDTVSTSYGFSGVNQTVFATLPCPQTSGNSCGTSYGNTSAYDMLGRLLSVTNKNTSALTNTYNQQDVVSVLSPPSSGEGTPQTQNQYDGLGRLTSSCKIESSGGSSCGQATGSSSGVVTTTSYSSAAGSQTTTMSRGGTTQQRSVTVDGLGRPTSIATPEGGTVTKTYDTYPSSCGTGISISGKLMKTVFANGNWECYQYSDGGINRLTDVGAGYSGGGGTLCTRFRYDATSKGWLSPPSGATISNVVGRLMEAETDNCVTPGNTSYTDEWYSYDADGNVTDIWESTPNSGGYYHSTATHYGNGALDVVTAPVNVTYGLDGEGRYSSSAESTQTEVYSTAYNAASQPTTINIGAGTDYDGYVYDSYTGLMKNWTFQVNSATETGALTWNLNGTLQELVINDGFNSGGSQTCYFSSPTVRGTGYDDLGRLVGVGCGTSSPWTGLWSQTFSFDQYDNITKAGSVTFNPGYGSNSTTNHYTGSSYSYDSGGNLTQDTINFYAWNQMNKLGSINLSGTNCATGGQCIVYDAMGRVVEIDSGGTASEIFYGHAGKYYMSGSTWTNTALNMPGGGLLYRASGWLIGHNDWLGSSRIISSIKTPAVDVDRAFAPYGEIYAPFGSTVDPSFTGDSQDILAYGTCCYDTPNRELIANQSRWLSPDPAGYGWNQYAYTTNPNSEIDPLGLAPGGCGGDNGTPCGPQGTTGLCTDSFGARHPCGYNAGCNATIDGGAAGDCGLVGGLLGSSESTVPCPPNFNCNHVYVTMNDEIYQHQYSNPDVFQCDGSMSKINCFPTHWVSTYLGNVDTLPSSVLCIHMGSTCDVLAGGQQLFQGNPQVWRAANGAMNDLTAAYALTPVVAAVPEVSLTLSVAAETYGIPVFATSLWVQQNWNTLMNWRRIIWNLYQQCQTDGPC